MLQDWSHSRISIFNLEIIQQIITDKLTENNNQLFFSDTRSAFRTVDTKRPFTPRQTDRRLYSGSTNHVARPPSSFRLLPLPEEDTWSRPGTGAGKQHSPTSAKLSPLSSQTSLEEPCFDNGKLPRILPQNISGSSRVSSSRGDKRNQFRASSLSDVLEVKISTILSLYKTPLMGQNLYQKKIA